MPLTLFIKEPTEPTDIDFAQHMEAVALQLLGDPTTRNKDEMRYGSKGSMQINKKEGWWHDYERDEKGGVLDLIKREVGLSGRQALEWMRDTVGVEIDSPSSPLPVPRTYTGDLIATHEYVDEYGEVVMLVKRFDLEVDKCKPYLPGKSWAGIYGDDGRIPPHIPYRLPDIINTEDNTVFIVEGEKCADALAAQGLVATTNDGGAGKWHTDLNQWFKGKTVFILPDNDEAGKKHADKVAKELDGVAASIKIVPLCRDMAKKSDVVDWLDAGNDVEELTAICANYEVTETRDRSDKLVSAWLVKDIPPRDYVLGEVMSTTSRWMVYGRSGLGKTLFALNMAAAISAGSKFLCWDVQKPRRVMYIDGEMPADTFKERMQQIAAVYGANMELWAYNRDEMGEEELPPLDEPEGQDWVLNEIKKINPEVVIFDSIMALLIGSMKDEEAWKPIIPFMRKLTSLRITQIWMDHTGHNDSQSYGTSTKKWQMDTVLRLEKIDDSTTGFRTTFDDKARLRNEHNFDQFKPMHAWMEGGRFHYEATDPDRRVSKRRFKLKDEYPKVIDELIASGKGSIVKGHDRRNVTAVLTNDVQIHLKDRGLLDVDENPETGVTCVTDNARQQLRRAKNDLIEQGVLAGDERMIWRIK